MKTFGQYLETNTNLYIDPVFIRFFEELSYYQSNHYGSAAAQLLYDAYQPLPPDFKAKVTANKTKLLKSFRGADSKTNKPVLSFTWNSDPAISHKNAQFYGHYVYSINDLQSYKGTIDTGMFPMYFGKVLWRQITSQFPIGDDENEILVLGGIFKQ